MKSRQIKRYYPRTVRMLGWRRTQKDEDEDERVRRSCIRQDVLDVVVVFGWHWPWSSVPNLSSRLVSASRNSIIPCAGTAICDLMSYRAIVCETCKRNSQPRRTEAGPRSLTWSVTQIYRTTKLFNSKMYLWSWTTTLLLVWNWKLISVIIIIIISASNYVFIEKS